MVRDRESGVFAKAGKVREIHHKGKYFNVPGPHICEPSPQRTPYVKLFIIPLTGVCKEILADSKNRLSFIFQAGTSKAGTEFGAKHAEAVFLGGQTPEKVRASVDALRETARKNGRDPSHIKMMAGMTIIIDETDAKAEQKKDDFLRYGDREGALALFGGWTGIDLSTYSDDEDFRFVKAPAVQSIVNRWSDTVPGSEGLKWNKSRIAEYLLLGGVIPKVVGGPQTVVDELERWVEDGGVDGFNLSHIVNPGSFDDMIEFLLPELSKRGLFKNQVAKEGATAREVFFGQAHVLDDHPAFRFKWNGEDR